MRKNTDQNNSEYGYFLRSAISILRKNFRIFDCFKVRGDFDIDFKSEEDLILDKLNTLCETFSLANLVEGHTVLQKPINFPWIYIELIEKSSFLLAQATETGT